MLEVLRHSAIAPMGIDHRATEDFKLCGYDIPKDTMVMANLYSVLRDPEHWETPDLFNPKGFLSADGNILKNIALIPFSTGPRVCFGETLARTKIFLFFANLLHHFRFSKVPGDPNYLTQYNCPSGIRGAVPYQTNVTRRE